MTRSLGTMVLIGMLTLGPAVPAAAAEEAGCRIIEVDDGYDEEATYEKVCWLVGSDGTHTLIEGEPPILYPQLGTNEEGSECWYWSTTATQLVIILRDGSVATIGQDVGVGIIQDTTVGACEGIPGEDLRTVAWDYLERWLLAEPEIELSPVSRGVTGFETYVWAPIPDRIDATLTSPIGTVLRVGAWVDRVVIDWGDPDASPLVLTESVLGRFTAYPDGSTFHVYDTKSCNEHGQTGCYPEVEGYPVTVSFRWQAAYRVGSNAWIDIGPVLPSTTVAYPVDEIITRIETTG